MKEHKIKLPYSLDAYMGTSEEVGMFDIDHFVAHYQCPELSLVPDSGFPVCCGERGSFNGELTANDSVSERLISLSCVCILFLILRRLLLWTHRVLKSLYHQGNHL